MDRSGRDARLTLLAGRQAGAFTFAQALSVGFPRATISRRLSTGAWVRTLPGVFRIGGTPRSRLLDLWSALLAVGPEAVLTHETAAHLHGAEGLPLSPITLTSPHGWHHRLPGIFVHQIDDLASWQRSTWNGLPVSSPARCVVELGATSDLERIGRVADDLVRSGRTTYSAIAAVLADVSRPGKPGTHTVARALDERGDGFVPPASELERRLFSALAAGGLPPPARQIPLPGRGRIAGIVDGGYLDAQIVLEADGRRWHARVAAGLRLTSPRRIDLEMTQGWEAPRFC